MTRSSNAEQAQRINAALELLKEYDSTAKAVAMLSKRYGISRSQSYRYLQKAASTGKELPVPEQKIPFTIKLSRELVQRLRQYAGSTGKSLSEIVTQALEAFLHGFQGRG